MQSLGLEVSEFLLRFSSSRISITQSCKEVVETVNLGSIVTMPTLSSFELTNEALDRLAKASANLVSAVEVIHSHRTAAIREFGNMIACMGLAAPETYLQHFENRVAHELALEAAELNAVLVVFEKAEVIGRFVQKLRHELQFDDVDIIFPNQGTCNEYASLALAYRESQDRLRRVAETREAWLFHKVRSASM